MVWTRQVSAKSAPHPGHWRTRRPLLLTLLVAGSIASGFTHGPRSRASGEPDLQKAVLGLLREQGLEGNSSDFRWVDPPRPTTRLDLSGHRFIALLRRSEEEPDVWLGRAELSPEGRILAVQSVHNLTDTSAVAERNLSVLGERVAFTVVNEGLTLGLHVADLRGQSLRALSDWTALDRMKMRLTFWQETGQLAGIEERAFDFEPPQADVQLHWSGQHLAVTTLAQQAQIAPDGTTTGSLLLRPRPHDLGHPGELVTWAVDRVRALPWFGSDRMQWLKTVAFTLVDYSSRVKSKVTDRDGAEEIRSALGETLRFKGDSTPNLETGWPPKPISTYLKPPLPGEGHFNALDDDVFAIPPEGGSSPFAFTFLRTDPARPHSQVFVVIWDPRRLELHTMSGTREPKTATGETGPGRVPRTPQGVGRLAAAFNGGFQATHGEFGMMAERVVYLPPKPYAATVAELDDGTTGFGTWPNEDSIGQNIVGYRQNLTPLLADGVVNPYRRTWWGGVPPGWEDATRTVRTGVCLTEGKHLAYFYGSSIDAEHLALAMTSAQCRYGVHLDMNPGHTGLEFYRVAPTSMLTKPKSRLESNWQSFGEVTDMPGWSFLGRRMLRSMQLMHFPRYVRTDSRDFFYLSHRPLLTHERLSNTTLNPQPQGLDWLRTGLPQQGFPPALAMAKLSPEVSRPTLAVSVVLVDAKWAKPCRDNCSATVPLLTSKATTTRGELHAYYAQRRFHIAPVREPVAAAGETAVIASGQSKQRSSLARAALGTTDGQWLYYLEVSAGAEPKQDLLMLDRLLSAFGCKERLFLERPLALSIGEQPSPHETKGETAQLTWLRDDSPMAHRILESTPVVPYDVWAPLQAKRIRYKRQRNPKPQAATPPAADTMGPTEPPARPEAASVEPSADTAN